MRTHFLPFWRRKDVIFYRIYSKYPFVTQIEALFNTISKLTMILPMLQVSSVAVSLTATQKSWVQVLVQALFLIEDKAQVKGKDTWHCFIKMVPT